MALFTPTPFLAWELYQFFVLDQDSLFGLETKIGLLDTDGVLSLILIFQDGKNKVFTLVSYNRKEFAFIDPSASTGKPCADV